MLVTNTVIVSLAIAMLCLIDLWNKKCSVMRRILWSPIPFIPLLGPMLYYALFDPPPVRQDGTPAPKNAMDEWKEWLDNRYNPGYFTGGQIHPMYRATGRAAGGLLVTSGIVMLGTVLLMVKDGVPEGSAAMLAWDVGISLVLILAGLVKIAEGKKKKRKEKQGRTPQR